MNVLEHLFRNGKFMLGINNDRIKGRLEKALLNEVQHAGFTYATKKEPWEENKKLIFFDSFKSLDS